MFIISLTIEEGNILVLGKSILLYCTAPGFGCKGRSTDGTSSLHRVDKRTAQSLQEEPDQMRNHGHGGFSYQSSYQALSEVSGIQKS